MIADKPTGKGYCETCGEELNRIQFTALCTEEWSWNGCEWECSAMHSLATDPQHPVLCPNCESVVGAGFDFGFGIGTKK